MAALIGLVSAVAVLLLTMLDDGVVRFMTISGDRTGRIIGLHLRSLLACVLLTVPACLALSDSLGAIVVGIVGVLAATMMAFAGDLLESFGDAGVIAVQLATWVVAGALCCFAIAAMYRFAPDRADAKWRWLSVGSVAATVLWLLATLGFGFYASRFAGYNATYGSLAAVVVLLMWLYVSAYAILFGGLINAEAERQTAEDSTTGPARPLGERGAVGADTSAALEG